LTVVLNMLTIYKYSL